MPVTLTGVSEPLHVRIRHARERAGLTQEQIATAVGVSPRTVGRWERGENVHRNRLGKLQDLLGVTLRETSVTLHTRDAEPASPPVGGGVDPEVLILLAEADPAAIEAVRAVLKAARREQ